MWGAKRTAMIWSAGIRRGWMVAAFFVSLTVDAAAQDWPSPPCDGSVYPDFGNLGGPPTVEVWLGFDHRETWEPPECIGWASRPFASMIAVAGRFRHAGGMAVLAEKVGAISSAKQILYWSVSRQAWRPLFAEAHALRSPDPDAARGDFAESEMRSGAALYFMQDENNPTGPVVYRLDIRVRTAARLVVRATNVSSVRLLLLPIFAPGEQEAINFLIHERDDVWRFYGLTRLGGGPDADAGDRTPSLINRAIALYRHIAGVPTDQDPPAAP